MCLPTLAGTLLLGSLAACGGDDVECESGTILLQDSNNFNYQGSIDVPSITTASAMDLDICWEQLVSDIQCHDLDPLEDIDNVALIRFPQLSQEDVEYGLSNDSLLQADIDGYVEYPTQGDTCTNLSEFTFFGTVIDVPEQYNEEGGTYLLLLTTGTEVGVGARMLTFLEPTSSSDNTTVDISAGCGVLDFEADLHSMETLPICTDGTWTVDWSELTLDGLGNELESDNIDHVMLGFYEGMTVDDLEAQFLDLELMATTLYELDLEGGSSADLGQASDGTSYFSGFSGDGVWILALQCSRCYNPAPLFLTVLEPAEPAE